MKKIITTKSALPVLHKKRAIAAKSAAGEAAAKQRRAQMPEYLLEPHPELCIEALPGLPVTQSKS